VIEPRIRDIDFKFRHMILYLNDDCEMKVPYWWWDRIHRMSLHHRLNCQIIDDGKRIVWPNPAPFYLSIKEILRMILGEPND
jgi:hypothetical protein